LNPRDFGHFERRVTFRECDGVIINAQDGTFDTDLTNPGGPNNNVLPSLVGMTAQIATASGSIVINVTPPSNLVVRAAASISYVRRPASGPTGPAPTVGTPSVASGSSSGGTSFDLPGTHFTGARMVTLAGTPASFRWVNDSLLRVTSAQYFGLGGAADIVVTTGNGSGTAIAAWTYIVDSFAIFGASAHVWKNTALQQSGGVVTSWADQNIAAPLAAMTSTHPDLFTVTAFPIGAGNSVFGWAIVRPGTTAANQATTVLSGYQFYGIMFNTSGQINGYGGNRTATGAIATDFRNSSNLFTVFSDSAAVGSGGVTSTEANNGTPATSTGTGSPTTPATATAFFGGSGVSFPFNGEVVEWGICPFASGTAPSAGQQTAIRTYAHNIYGTL
jgi:hypothetical protein